MVGSNTPCALTGRSKGRAHSHTHTPGPGPPISITVPVRGRRDPVEVVSPRLPRYDDREIGTSSKNPVNYSPKHPGCNDGVKLLSRRDSNKQPESSANKPDSNKQNWKINLLNFCLVLDAFFVEKIHKWVMIFLKSTCQRTFASPARCEAKHADDHLDKWP